MVFAIQIIAALYLVYVVALRPDLILPAAIYAAVFDAAAIVNANGIGVQPYYFLLALLSVRCLVVRSTGQDVFGRTDRVQRIVSQAVLFAMIAVAGCVVLPRVFAGADVISPRVDMNGYSPLAFSTSNFAQGVYVALNTIFLWWVAHQTWSSNDVRRVISAYRGAGLLVLAIGFYQIAHFYTDVPFPSEILYSNSGYAILSDEQIAGMPRVSSTFTETAGMSPFMLGYLAFTLDGLIRGRSRGLVNWGIAGASLTLLLVSTSSTAYLGLGALFVFGVVKYGLLSSERRGARWKVFVGAAAIVGVMFVVIVSSPALQDVIQQTVLDKRDSSSYEGRHSADMHSYELTLQTYALGVGLGSTWSSGFLPSLLASTGALGTLAFAGMVVAMFMANRRKTPWLREEQSGIATALCLVLVADLTSCPSVATASMWTLFAMITGLTTAAENPQPITPAANPDEARVFLGRPAPARTRSPEPFAGARGTT